MSGNFVTLDNIVASILLEIGDEGNKRYAIKARQWALDEYRRLNTHLSNVYMERKVEIDDNNTGEIPEESVKLVSVGIYKNGQFSPFVKLPDMQLMAEDIQDNIFDPKDIQPIKTDRFKGGYWCEDKENSRFFVRNYSNTGSNIEDTTFNIKTRVVIRYRTSGLNLGGDIFIPGEARDYIVSSVAFKFKKNNIPVRLTNLALQQEAIQVDFYKDAYTALLYEPGSFYEIKDAIFGRV